MGELRDWCISRQLWWGHRIPVFYCGDCDHEFASLEDEPSDCPKCSSKNIAQDPDVLDTWFSSALWPFSTLGWGNGDSEMDKLFRSEDIKNFYPNSLLITGFDILFFWVARMMMMGEKFMGELPFNHIYLHALVRDKDGNKMSKSKGNVIDPLDMVDKYSADALRFTLAVLAVQGRDIRLSDEKLELSRNFTNKLFNAHKFLLLNVDSFKDMNEIEFKTPLGKYIRSRFNACVQETRAYLDEYRFNDGATVLYRFLWNEFCSWAIELSKANKESIDELGAVFKESMKLLHPYMPFITEHLYHSLSNTTLESGTSVMIMKYPETADRDEVIEKQFGVIMDAIVSIRRAKTLVDFGEKKIESAYVKLNDSGDEAMMKPFIEKLAKVEDITFTTERIDGVSDVGEMCEVYIKTDSIDLSPIIDRLTKQCDKLDIEIGKLTGMLSNKKFIENAPKEQVDKNKMALREAKDKQEKINEQLASLQG
jgi:valyl-tRNA synthetase